MSQTYYFGAGPAALPGAVLERVRGELLDFRGTGLSILELSHRSAPYEEVHQDAQTALRELLGGAPDGLPDHAILFMGGGARTQFAATAANLMPAGGRADYVLTGRWAEMARDEGAKRGEARVAWSSADDGYDRVPAPDEVEVDRDAAFVHVTSNNTVVGTQYPELPPAAALGDVPLVVDASSDIGGIEHELGRCGVVYAGAQKNLGPAGVTVVLVRRDLLDRSGDDLPDTLNYRKMAAKDSLLNTPPVFAIYVLGLTVRHHLARGGLAAVAAENAEKARLVYGAIDASGGFYRGHARRDSRSRMNATFRLPTPELEGQFLAEAAEGGMTGLKGHRSVGGIRASLYNAVELAAVRALVAFMDDFRLRHG